MPKTLQPDIMTGPVVHQWTVAEYTQYERNRFWYIFMISVAVMLVVWGMVSNNFLFSLIIILASIILYFQSHQEPLSVSFAIAELGVIVGNRFYPYDELTGFYIIYNPPEVKTLFLVTKNPIRPNIKVWLADVNPNDIRGTLQAFLTEDIESTEEPMSDMIARRWRLL